MSLSTSFLGQSPNKLDTQLTAIPAKEFEIVQMALDLDSGFNALDANRKELGERLVQVLKIKQNKESRRLIGSEIFDAFYVYHKNKSKLEAGVPTPSDDFKKRLRALESTHLFLFSYCQIEMKDNFPECPFSGHLEELSSMSTAQYASESIMEMITRLKRERQKIFEDLVIFQKFRDWLKENQSKDKKYGKAYSKMATVTRKLEEHLSKLLKKCATRKSCTHYVQKYYEGVSTPPPLGEKSAILYAQTNDFSLFIWEAVPTNHQLLTLVNGYVGSSDVRKDILKVDQFVHFNRLIPKGAEAFGITKSPSPSAFPGRWLSGRRSQRSPARDSKLSMDLRLSTTDLIVSPPDNYQHDVNAVPVEQGGKSSSAAAGGGGGAAAAAAGGGGAAAAAAAGGGAVDTDSSPYTTVEYSLESANASTYERVISLHSCVNKLQGLADGLFAGRQIDSAAFHNSLYLSTLFDRYFSLSNSAKYVDRFEQGVEKLSTTTHQIFTEEVNALVRLCSQAIREEATSEEICAILEADYRTYHSRHGLSESHIARMQDDLDWAGWRIIDQNPSAAEIKKFIQIWIAFFTLVGHEFACSSSLVVFKRINSLDGSLRLPLLGTFFERIIKASQSKRGALEALKRLFDAQSPSIGFLRDNDHDDLIIDSLNSEELQRQDSFEYYLLYAKTLLLITGHDEKRLTKFFKKIRFTQSYELPRALYKVFVEEQPDIPTSICFLNALTKAMKLIHFNNESTVAQTSSKTIVLFDHLLADGRSERTFARQLCAEESPYCKGGRFHPHAMLSPLFLYASFNKQGSEDRLTLYRILFHLGNNLLPTPQIAFCNQLAKHPLSNSRDLGDTPRKTLDQLIKCLANTFNYFNLETSSHGTSFRRLWLKFREKFVDAARQTHGKSIKEVIEILENISHHSCSQQGKVYLMEIFKHPGSLGKYQSGCDAVEGMFEDVMGGDIPSEWPVDTILERLYFLYCYVKYPVGHYHEWFMKANISRDAQSNDLVRGYAYNYLPKTIDELEQVKRSIQGHDQLSDMGFKILQNNQVFAVKSAINPPNDAQAVFLKVGTGQGKSLIIALTALHYALQKPGQKVVVFTVYEHLAERDYKRFEKLFEMKGIKSGLIDDATNKTQIVYADLHTYFGKMREQGLRRMGGEATDIEYDFFEKAVVILDEFDSILLDVSDFETIVTNMGGKMKLPELSQSDFITQERFKKKFSESLGPFFAKMSKYGLDEGFTEWFNQSKSKGFKEGGKKKPDSLGNVFTKVGSPFYQLTKKTLSSRVFYYKLFAFLKGAEKVIGVSGSTSREAAKPLNKLFSKGCAFFDIPPFFDYSGTKLREINKRAPLPASRVAWKKAILSSVQAHRNLKRPVLVFATSADFKDLEGDLVGITGADQLGRMQKPKDVRVESLTRAVQPQSVTLATIAAGRGADFKIPDDLLYKICSENLDEGGLHVIITYIPKKKGAKDSRQIIQMAGRAGRWDQPGTWELISTENKNYYAEVENSAKIEDYELELHRLSKDVYEKMCETPRADDVWQKWAWLNLFLDDVSSYPSGLRKEADWTDREGNRVPGKIRGTEEQARIVVEEVLGAKVVPARSSSASVATGSCVVQ